MFRKNDQPKQSSFFDSDFVLPERLKQRLQQSWATTFRQEVFDRIPEEEFAVLYSEQDSRPNAPVNVMVGADILKSGFGWTDAELEERLSFDLLVRHALGLTELADEGPTLRTLYNFRRRVREYAQQESHNLYQAVFEQITDQQLAQLELATGWQRLDSTQLLSNIAQVNRLELVLGVLQQGVKALPAAAQQGWQQAQPDYLQPRPQHICFGLKSSEIEPHLLGVGNLLLALLVELEQAEPAAEMVSLIRRVLNEQYLLEADQQLQLRPTDQIGANTLQSVHDPSATFRTKGAQSYRGYVTNLSETCDPDNPLQLITSVQTAPNHTDDQQLLIQAVREQARRQVGLNQATVDGGYTGPEADQACLKAGVQLRPTRIRGGPVAADRFGWERYQWELNDQAEPVAVTCPLGQQVPVQPGRKPHRRLAYFPLAACHSCPFFERQCRVAPRKKGPVLSIPLRSIHVARLRQGMTPDNKAIRAAVEASIRSLKRPFPASKLPVRGLIRAQMVVLCSAVVVNLRRIHRYLLDQADRLTDQPDPAPTGPTSGSALAIFWTLSLLLLLSIGRSYFNLLTSRRPSIFLDHFRSVQVPSLSSS